MLRLDWTVGTAGWADCVIADQDAEVTVESSYITAAPEELLTAVARLMTGESETRADFEAEPTRIRWIFHRDSKDVRIRILQLPHRRSGDPAGIEIWASQQPLEVLVRTVIRCFDKVAETYGESEYHSRWRRRFPRPELEALRTLWRVSRTGRIR